MDITDWQQLKTLSHKERDLILKVSGFSPHAWGARFEGRQAVRQGLASRFEGLPDVNYGNEEHYVDAERQAGISKWTLTGTTRDGRRLEVRGCDFYSFREGLATRKDSYWKIVEGA